MNKSLRTIYMVTDIALAIVLAFFVFSMTSTSRDLVTILKVVSIAAALLLFVRAIATINVSDREL